MADKIFVGGTILTMVDNAMEAEAVAVKDGRILAVGSHDTILAYKQDTTEMVDLGDHALLPGFIEPHTHPINTAVARHCQLDLGGFEEGTRGEELWSRLRGAVRDTPRGEWIVGHSVNPILVPDFPLPTRPELDQLTTDHPLYLVMSHWSVTH